MLRILPLLILGLLAILLYRGYVRLPNGERKTWLLRLAIGAFLGLVLFALLTGKLNWLGALAMGALPFLSGVWRWLNRGLAMARLWRAYGQRNAPFQATGLTLTDEARDGQLHAGPHAGRQLSSLSQQQLDEALQFFRTNDPTAASLLTLYIVKHCGTEWTGSPLQQGNQSAMTEQEACALLGVAASADKKTIIQAHRKLIQKFHPDRGGNEYLATRINLAKDTLLRRFS